MLRVESEREKVFDLGGIRKNYSIGCQISRSKNRYMVFQHKLLFNIVKDLFNWFEGLERSVKVRVQSESERIVDLGGIQKSTRYVVKFRGKDTRYVVFQHKLVFNLVKDLFKWIEDLGRSVKVQVQSDRERIFALGGIYEKVLDTLSKCSR